MVVMNLAKEPGACLLLFTSLELGLPDYCFWIQTCLATFVKVMVSGGGI